MLRITLTIHGSEIFKYVFPHQLIFDQSLNSQSILTGTCNAGNVDIYYSQHHWCETHIFKNFRPIGYIIHGQNLGVILDHF